MALASDVPAIVCTALEKRFPDIHAVRGVDLTVARGECLALLGPNGAGKTTTVEMIEGLTEPSSGRIELFGRPWGTGEKSDRQIRAGLGVCLQENNFQERLSVVETVDLFRSFYEDPAPAAELIGLVALEAKARSQVGKLSGGQRQRLALACALAGRPSLLCLDEPTTGLDPQSRRQVWDIVEGFRRGGGTVLLTTHYMEEAEHLADRVAIMDHGLIIARGTSASLIASLGASDIADLVFDRPPALEPFRDLPGVSEARLVEAHHLRLVAPNIAAILPALLERAAQLELALVSLGTHKATLEDVFIHYTGRALRDA
jgi:ABC-2 type transport system ATP-binding protein